MTEMDESEVEDEDGKWTAEKSRRRPFCSRPDEVRGRINVLAVGLLYRADTRRLTQYDYDVLSAVSGTCGADTHAARSSFAVASGARRAVEGTRRAAVDEEGSVE